MMQQALQPLEDRQRLEAETLTRARSKLRLCSSKAAGLLSAVRTKEETKMREKKESQRALALQRVFLCYWEEKNNLIMNRCTFIPRCQFTIKYKFPMRTTIFFLYTVNTMHCGLLVAFPCISCNVLWFREMVHCSLLNSFTVKYHIFPCQRISLKDGYFCIFLCIVKASPEMSVVNTCSHCTTSCTWTPWENWMCNIPEKANHHWVKVKL